MGTWSPGLALGTYLVGRPGEIGEIEGRSHLVARLGVGHILGEVPTCAEECRERPVAASCNRGTVAILGVWIGYLV